jgi:predicted nucleic acid-binding protein
MKPTVLDASALLAMFFGEPAVEEMRGLFHRATAAGQPLLITAVNWTEVLNRVLRRQGPAGMATVRLLATSGPLAIVAVDAELAEIAAGYKAADRLALADAFAAALAKQRHADLVTADREFKTVEKEIAVVWLKS